MSDKTIEDTRLALCRCGQSHNKPFCDNTHRDVGFEDPGDVGRSECNVSSECNVK
jgi:CDGSH-type Zn-finger protein